MYKQKYLVGVDTLVMRPWLTPGSPLAHPGSPLARPWLTLAHPWLTPKVCCLVANGGRHLAHFSNMSCKAFRALVMKVEAARNV